MNIDEKEQLRRRQLLQKLLDEHFEGNRQNLGKFLGYKDGTFVRHMLTEHRAIREKTIDKIQSYPKFATWFNPENADSNPGNISAPTSQYKKVVAVDAADNHFVQIQKVKLRLSAGITGFQSDIEHDNGSTISIPRKWMEDRGYQAEHLVAVKVRGESMVPALNEGDTVVINTADTTPKDGFAYAINYEGEAVIKRLSRDAGEWWLTSDNPDQRKYHRKVCRGNECIIVGLVVRKESDVI